MDNINDYTNIFIKNITDSFLASLKQQVSKLVNDNISAELRKLDVPMLAREHLSNVLNSKGGTFNFPERSIQGSAVDPIGLYLRPDQILPGTFQKFESTGIQDSANHCQVTIMDNATVFENTLVANSLHIAVDAVIDGALTVNGKINPDSSLFKDVADYSLEKLTTGMREGLLGEFRKEVLIELEEKGIGADKIRVAHNKLVTDGKLAPNILFSNLQKVGPLRDLQVVGETLLDETIYVSNNRVGINTIEPEGVFDLWDQEIELVMGKYGKNIGMFGTPKPQHVVLSSNKNNNLVLNPDGSITVEMLYIGKVPHSSADSIPTANVPKGHIVWNTDPKIGGPIGWVSLGGANWAQFGQITA